MKALRAILATLVILAALALLAWFALDDPRARSKPKKPVASAPVAERPVEPPAEVEPDAATDPARAILFGTVSDDHGEPVAGAEVVLTAADSKHKTRSLRDGFFELKGVPRAATLLEVSAKGYETARFEDPGFPDEPRIRWDVELSAVAGVNGVVLCKGEPAVGAWVTMRRPGERKHAGATRTDSAGRFAVKWPEQAEPPYEVVAWHGQLGRAKEEVEGPSELTLELPGGGYLEGRVMDRKRRPIESFTVTASVLNAGAGGPPAQSFDNPNGTFRLGPLSPGRIRVWAAAPGYAPWSRGGFEIQAGETTAGALFYLERSTVLTGRVTDAATGQPIEGASLIPAEWKSGALASSVGTYTDANGRYRMDALPTKRTSIKVTAEGYRELLVGGVNGRSKRARRDIAMSRQRNDQVPGRELMGIGAVLKKHRGGVAIGDILEGAPASEHLKKGDVVVKVGKVNARKASLAGVAQAIRGEEGSEVVLWVKRQGRGEAERVVLTRKRVVMPDRNHRKRRN